MKKSKISINFEVEVRKDIYEQSPWNTSYQDFIEETILTHIHEAEFVQREFKKLSKENQEKYAGFLKTTDNISEDIMESVSYTLLEENETNQKVAISFNFNFYDSEKYPLKEFINNYIFQHNIDANEVLAKNMIKMADNTPKEKIDLAVNIFTHIADMLKKAKKNKVVKEDGQEIKLTQNKTKKLK